MDRGRRLRRASCSRRARSCGSPPRRRGAGRRDGDRAPLRSRGGRRIGLLRPPGGEAWADRRGGWAVRLPRALPRAIALEMIATGGADPAAAADHRAGEPPGRPPCGGPRGRRPQAAIRGGPDARDANRGLPRRPPCFHRRAPAGLARTLTDALAPRRDRPAKRVERDMGNSAGRADAFERDRNRDAPPTPGCRCGGAGRIVVVVNNGRGPTTATQGRSYAKR